MRWIGIYAGRNDDEDGVGWMAWHHFREYYSDGEWGDSEGEERRYHEMYEETLESVRGDAAAVEWLAAYAATQAPVSREPDEIDKVQRELNRQDDAAAVAG